MIPASTPNMKVQPGREHRTICLRKKYDLTLVVKNIRCDSACASVASPSYSQILCFKEQARDHLGEARGSKYELARVTSNKKSEIIFSEEKVKARMCYLTNVVSA